MPAETKEQHDTIRLRWAQKVAASWSIFWPSWIVSLAVAAFLLPADPGDQDLMRSFAVGTVLRMIIQGLLCRRLVRKNYQSFYVSLLREGDEEPSRRMLPEEQGRIGLQFLLPQLVLTFLLGWFYLTVPAEIASSLNSLANFVVIFVINPAALSWAMGRNYPGFRLQAYQRKGRRNSAWSSLRNLEE
jgi:hypothetical protein